MGVHQNRVQQLEIHARRAERGWSCDDVSRATGLTRDQVCAVMCGRDDPPASAFVAVIRALDPGAKPESYIRL